MKTSCLALVSLLAACSGEISTGSEDETSAALSSCGTSSYNAALAHYQAAVAGAKARLSSGACASEGAMQMEIADEASFAVMTCDAFRSTIRTSPWAAPLRKALGPSLTLRSLTGELLVIRDSSYQSWKGVEALLPGTSFWARGQGAYGPPVRMDFAANGKATVNALVMDDVTGDVSWSTTSAAYEVTHTTTQGRRHVKVMRAGSTTDYELRVENPTDYKAAPTFVLEPSSSTPALYSLVGECDA